MFVVSVTMKTVFSHFSKRNYTILYYNVKWSFSESVTSRGFMLSSLGYCTPMRQWSLDQLKVKSLVCNYRNFPFGPSSIAYCQDEYHAFAESLACVEQLNPKGLKLNPALTKLKQENTHLETGGQWKRMRWKCLQRNWRRDSCTAYTVMLGMTWW